MEKKRVLIYGNDKSFSKYLKYKFQHVLLFDVCRDFRLLDDDLSIYSTIILMVYTEQDLLDFIKIGNKGIPLVICSYNEKITEALSDYFGIFLLDTTKVRSGILEQLEFYFQKTILKI